MILNTVIRETVIELDGARFNVKELDTSTLTRIAVLGRDNPAGGLLETFKSHVTGWENVVDRHNDPIVCSEESKEAIFEANHKFVERLISEIQLAFPALDELEKKISELGPSGI